MQDVRMYCVYQQGLNPQFVAKERVSGLVNIGPGLVSVEAHGDDIVVTVMDGARVTRRFGFLIVTMNY